MAKRNQKDEAIARIRATRGLANQIANLLGIDRAAVYQWQRVPISRVHVVASVIDMKPEDIRPDIFGAPPWISHGLKVPSAKPARSPRKENQRGKSPKR